MKLYLHATKKRDTEQTAITDETPSKQPQQQQQQPQSSPVHIDTEEPVDLESTPAAVENNSIPRTTGGFMALMQQKFTRDMYNPFLPLYATGNEQVRKYSSDMYYFNQLGSDLANERTFLAWIRTMLACIRTIFAFEKLQVEDARDTSLVVAVMLMGIMLLWTGISGGHRYYRTRNILLSASDNKPKTYNMLSLFPFVAMGFVTALLTSVATFTNKWWE
jgi:uncharacterized membrane protein YidH (DUF202 family)